VVVGRALLSDSAGIEGDSFAGTFFGFGPPYSPTPERRLTLDGSAAQEIGREAADPRVVRTVIGSYDSSSLLLASGGKWGSSGEAEQQVAGAGPSRLKFIRRRCSSISAGRADSSSS